MHSKPKWLFGVRRFWYIFLFVYLSAWFFEPNPYISWGQKLGFMYGLKTKVYLSLGDPALARFGDGGRFLSEEESAPQRRDLRAVIP